jgi:hypothetical protein
MIEFEFESTPETDAMLKQICVKECFVRCKDCKYWLQTPNGDVCARYEKADMEDCNPPMEADDFCSRGERKDV